MGSLSVCRWWARALVALVWVVSFPADDAFAELLGRLPATPGGNDYQAYYDDVLDVTWLADANLAASHKFGVPTIGANGLMNAATAAAYIDAMNAAGYLGFSSWRLQTLEPIDGLSFDYAESYDGTTDVGYNMGASGTAYAGSTASEFAHLYYVTLGNSGYYGTNGAPAGCAQVSPFCRTQDGPFLNVGDTTYWIGTPYAPNPVTAAWAFSFGTGGQRAYGDQLGSYVWPILGGDAAMTGMCADGNEDRKVTAGDALIALRTAVGLDTCPLCMCDPDGSSKVTATDALVVLRVAVGLSVSLNCPAC